MDRLLEGPLSLPVVGAGDGSMDGSTRKKITVQLEDIKLAVLSKAIEDHPVRHARPVTMFRQLDKLSGAWLLALPGALNGLPNMVFAEAMSAHLALPSPACMSRLGQRVGSTTVDQWGDKVINNSTIPGDSWHI